MFVILQLRFFNHESFKECVKYINGFIVPFFSINIFWNCMSGTNRGKQNFF
uniref:Uncharacterized protein n=1 Tax=Setaria italica TaxID=4555 RepID=K3Z1V5_SETIT